jgi:transposase-like protein
MAEKGSKASRGRFVPGGHYDKKFIAKVVEEVLKGKPKRVVQLKYGLNRSTLNTWLEDIDLAVETRRIGSRVPIDLKRSVVRTVRSGRLSMREAMITYGIKTPKTIERWIKELEQENADLVESNAVWMKKNKTTPKDTTEKNADVKALQKALEEAQLMNAALNTLIDVAEEQFQINIRKKAGAKQSND